MISGHGNGRKHQEGHGQIRIWERMREAASGFCGHSHVHTGSAFIELTLLSSYYVQSTIFQNSVYSLYRYIRNFTVAVPGAWNLEQKRPFDFLLQQFCVVRIIIVCVVYYNE